MSVLSDYKEGGVGNALCQLRKMWKKGGFKDDLRIWFDDEYEADIVLVTTPLFESWVVDEPVCVESILGFIKKINRDNAKVLVNTEFFRKYLGFADMVLPQPIGLLDEFQQSSNGRGILFALDRVDRRRDYQFVVSVMNSYWAKGGKEELITTFDYKPFLNSLNGSVRVVLGMSFLEMQAVKKGIRAEINASRMENFGFSLYEAMMFGKPIIALKNGFIEYRNDEWLVDSEEEAVEKLLNVDFVDPAIVEHLAVENLVEQYRDALNEFGH